MGEMAANEEKKYTLLRGAALHALWPHTDPQLPEVELSGLRLLGSPESFVSMTTPPRPLPLNPRQEDKRVQRTGTLPTVIPFDSGHPPLGARPTEIIRDTHRTMYSLSPPQVLYDSKKQQTQNKQKPRAGLSVR